MSLPAAWLEDDDRADFAPEVKRLLKARGLWLTGEEIRRWQRKHAEVWPVQKVGGRLKAEYEDVLGFTDWLEREGLARRITAERG